MASDKDDYSDVISRRRFVELTGVSGAAALAGCGGGGGDGDGDGDGGSDGDGGDGDGDGMTDEGDGGDGDGDGDGDGGMDVADVTHVGVTTGNPANFQFNPINAENGPQISQQVLFDQFAMWNFNDSEYKSAGIESWEFTGDAFEMTVREGLTWSNGEDVTGEDIARQIRFNIADEAALSEWVGDISVDGRNVTLSVESDINPNLVQVDVLERQVRTDEETYGEFDGETAEDVDIEGLRNFADSEPVTNGIFSLEDRGEQRVLTSRNADHPDAGNVNFAEYAFDVYDGNNARQQALLSLDVDSDFSVAVPARLVANFPDAVEEVRFPDIFGIGFTPNHNDPYAGDRAVRQAVAYAIDRSLCVQNSLPRAKRAPPVLTGLSSDAQESFLNFDDFESYGVDEKDFDSASSVLEDAGYSEQDGTWVDDGGDTVSLTFTCPAGWSDWVLAAETAVQHLNEFGFDAEFATTGSYFDLIQQDDWQFLCNTWLHGGPTTYPYRSLRHQLWEPQLHAAKYNFPAALDSDQVGGSEEMLSTENGEIDVGTQVNALATASSDEDANALITELAHAANEALPMIPIAEKRLQSWMTNDQWSLPDMPAENVPESRVAFPPTWLPRYEDYFNYTGN